MFTDVQIYQPRRLVPLHSAGSLQGAMDQAFHDYVVGLYPPLAIGMPSAEKHEGLEFLGWIGLFLLGMGGVFWGSIFALYWIVRFVKLFL